MRGECEPASGDLQHNSTGYFVAQSNSPPQLDNRQTMGICHGYNIMVAHVTVVVVCRDDRIWK